MNNTLIGSLYLTVASSIWGGMYVVVKHTVSVIPPLELVWMRYAIALITLIIIGLASKQNWRVSRQHLLLIGAISIIGYVISIITQETGTMLSSAQMGAIITSTTPAFMVLFASMILKERLTFKKSISVILATIGVLTIVGIDDINLSSTLGGLSLLIRCLNMGIHVSIDQAASNRLFTDCRNSLCCFHRRRCFDALCHTAPSPSDAK